MHESDSTLHTGATPAGLPQPVPDRPTGLVARAAPALRPQDQKIDRSLHPGWMTGAERPPRAGDVVCCTGGVGTVLRVLGRTGDGSRLLEIGIPGGTRASFYAAASNVLVQPPGDGAVIRLGAGGL